MTERKPFLLRIDPDLYAALARWADDDLRSLNGQIEFLMHRSLGEAGRLPAAHGRKPREAPRIPVSARTSTLRPAAPKRSGLRAQGHQPAAAAPRTPAPPPAASKPVEVSQPVKRPADDWDAKVD